jgi:accessory gene regulator B
MLETIASKLTSYMVAQGVIPKEDEEIYVFGWTMLLLPAGSFVVILLIGAFFGQLLGSAIFLLFFSLLRSYSGGWHADSFIRCFLTTIALYGCCLLLHFYLPESSWGWTLLALSLMSIFIIFRWAPVDHPNKPFRGQDKQKNKRLSRITVLAQSILILGLMFWQPWLKPYLLWAALGMTVTSFTLLYLICHSYKTT